MNITATTDGVHYLSTRPPSPFHLRWLVPLVCRQRPLRWVVAARASLAVYVALVGVYAHQRGVSWPAALAAALLVAGLPSLRFLWRRPILIDAPALALATAAAVVGWWPAAVAVVLVAGAASERAPVFAALYAWNPLLLVGLAVPAVTALVRKPGKPLLDERNTWLISHPVQASREFHAGQWRSAALMVAPWGVCLAGLVDPAPALLATLAVAYAQLGVAADSVRLYQWAAPVLAVAAVSVIPAAWLVPAVVAHWVNPWAGNGV